MYTGGARRAIEARIERHLSKVKKFHWHIDYLLGADGVCVRKVFRHAEDECTVNQQVHGSVLTKGFGASDCRSGCVSHLKKIGADDRHLFFLHSGLK